MSPSGSLRQAAIASSHVVCSSDRRGFALAFFGRPTGCLRRPFELPVAARRPLVEPPSYLADLIQPAS